MSRLPSFVLLMLVVTASLDAQTTIRASLTSQGSEFNVESKEAVVSPDGRFVAFTLPFGFGLQEIYVRDLIQGTTIVASSSANGTPSNGLCRGPSFSADGLLMAFESNSGTLVPGDTNLKYDVFVKNLNDGSITRESVGPGGVEANGNSTAAALSADGRFVAFESRALNLIPGFTTSSVATIYRHDRLTGANLGVSVATSGTSGFGSSLHPSISADGRFVAFDSDAADLVPVDTNMVRDVFVRDLVMGTTVMASVSTAGLQGADISQLPEISRDGALVAFIASAGSLGAWGLPPSATGSAVVVKHLATTVELIAPADATDTPKFSADSRFIVFSSVAALVTGDTNGWVDVFVQDRLTGVITRENLAADGSEANAPSADAYVTPSAANGRWTLSISGDGRFVAFTSLASNLVPGDTNGTLDAYVRDRSCSAVYTTFGQGTPGTSGRKPILAGFEGPCTGGWSMVVANALGGAQGMLAASFTEAIPAMPLGGGFVYLTLDPQMILVPFTLSGPANVPGAGYWSLGGFDISLLAGLRIFHQAAVFDPAASQGIALTNAVQGDY